MRTRDKERICCTVFVVSIVFIFAACAGGIKAQKDPFFDKWTTMAETSTGHSPAPKAKIIDMSEATATKRPAGIASAKMARSLPTDRISIKMRNEDVKVFLRSMARIEGLNLLIKNDVKGDITVDFRNIPWNEAFLSILRLQGLTYVWEGENIIRVATEEDIDKREAQAMGVRLVEQMTTVLVPIDYADATKLTVNLQEFLTKDKDGKPRGSVKVDEHSNSLIINAVREDIKRMIPIIEKIDKPTPQIMIKANIVETTKETARALGVQWGGMWNTRLGNHDLFVTPGGFSGSTSANPLAGGYTPVAGPSGISAPGISGQGFGVNFPVPSQVMTSATAAGLGSLGLIFGTIGGNVLEMQLQALQKDGKLNILSSPSITTLDNQKAYTENGTKVPYVSLTTSGVGGGVTQQVMFEEAVLRLEITPHVIDGKNLKMKILIKKDEVDLVHTVQGNPFIIKKQTETSLIVQDGETIVISGLSKQTNADDSTGIPGLKNVPILGWLFKEDDKDNKLEEVLIFITPKILQPQVAAAAPPTEGSQTEQPPLASEKNPVK